MKFYALYFLNSSVQRQASDQLYSNARKFNVYFIRILSLIDLPDTLKRQNIGISRWGFYAIARSDSDYSITQMQNYVSDLFYYEELPIDGELTLWFQKYCNVTKTQVVNPRNGQWRTVVTVKQKNPEQERMAKEHLKELETELFPIIDIYKAFEKTVWNLGQPLAEKIIDILIEIQHDYNAKIQSRYDSYWYNRNKGFEYMANLLENDIIPDLGEEYSVYSIQILEKYAKQLLDMAQIHINQAEQKNPEVWNKHGKGFKKPELKYFKKHLILMIEEKLKDTGVTLIFQTGKEYLKYLKLNFVIPPFKPILHSTAPPSAKKPRVILPPK